AVALTGELTMRSVASLVGIVCVAVLTTADSTAPSQGSSRSIRRVVTGNRPNGRSYVVSDTRVPVGNSTPNVFHANDGAPLGIGIGGDARILPFQQLDIELGAG